MKALRFTLEGKTAFFKKPEVNSYFYFTYGNIHKIALLGLFGAVLGYGGYAQMKTEGKKKKGLSPSEPEFYERLKELNVSIIPNAEKGFFRKKIQAFNNSVGYASKEQGGNLIVKEQWLENPSWTVYVLLDCEEAEKLAEAMMDHRAVYVPYLGKNDHYADLKSVVICELQSAATGQGILGSLFLKENVTQEEDDDEMTYKYQERLPVAMDEWANSYILKTFLFTDAYVTWENDCVYESEGKYLMFH